MEASVGREQTFTDSQEMGRAAFRMYAEAIQDANPLYANHEFVHGLGLRDVMAPPTLICDTFRFFGDDIDEAGHPLALEQECAGAPLRAGNEYEFFQPSIPATSSPFDGRLRRSGRRRAAPGPLYFSKLRLPITTSVMSFWP